MDFNTYVKINKASRQLTLRSTSNVVCGLGGDNLMTVGQADVHVTTIGLVKFLIVKGLGYPAILGADQLERGLAKFDFESDTKVWFGLLFPLHRCSDSGFKSEISTFTTTGRSDIDKLLDDYKEILDAPGRPLPACPVVECEIPTDSRPIRQRAYKTPLAKRQIISEQIDKMLAQNIIRPSSSRLLWFLNHQENIVSVWIIGSYSQ